jgi:protein-tyrosine phosphatase
MRDHGVSRVCCLLDVGQLRTFLVPLKAEYERGFGADRVLMTPIPDHYLCPESTLRDLILPFLQSAEASGERVVVHCWGGNGRTGHVLSAWLVAARGLKPMEAIEAVEAAGRLPREAVLAGNADLRELVDLLAKCEA